MITSSKEVLSEVSVFGISLFFVYVQVCFYRKIFAYFQKYYRTRDPQCIHALPCLILVNNKQNFSDFREISIVLSKI